MIADRIENLKKYAPYMDAVRDVADFLEKNDAWSLEAGRY